MNKQFNDLDREEIEDAIQEVYSSFRQRIGDYKLDYHPWETRPERFDALARYLEALAEYVRNYDARRN